MFCRSNREMFALMLLILTTNKLRKATMNLKKLGSGRQLDINGIDGVKQMLVVIHKTKKYSAPAFLVTSFKEDFNSH